MARKLGYAMLGREGKEVVVYEGKYGGVYYKTKKGNKVYGKIIGDRHTKIFVRV